MLSGASKFAEARSIDNDYLYKGCSKHNSNTIACKNKLLQLNLMKQKIVAIQLVLK